MSEIQALLRRHNIVVQELRRTFKCDEDSILKCAEKRSDWILSSGSFFSESRRLALAVVLELGTKLPPLEDAIGLIALAEASNDALLSDTLYQIEWNKRDFLDVAEFQGIRKTVVQQNYVRAKRKISLLKILPRTAGKVRIETLENAADGKWKSLNSLEATLLACAFAASWRELASDLRILVGPRSLRQSFGRFRVEETKRVPSAPATGKRITESVAKYSQFRQYLVKGRDDEFEVRVSFGKAETNFFWVAGSSLGIVSKQGKWIGEINKSKPILSTKSDSSATEFSLRLLPS